MKSLCQFIVSNIVDHPDEVEVDEVEDNGITIFNVKVNPEDAGKVIGKGGKVIKSIRQIMLVRAIKEGKQINLQINP
ncbi:MAG TPA: KH domain-containing protein [Patescibacteria group bacterium]